MSRISLSLTRSRLLEDAAGDAHCPSTATTASANSSDAPREYVSKVPGSQRHCRCSYKLAHRPANGTT